MSTSIAMSAPFNARVHGLIAGRVPDVASRILTRRFPLRLGEEPFLAGRDSHDEGARPHDGFLRHQRRGSDDGLLLDRRARRTVAPMPMVTPSLTVVPWTTAACPMVTSSPTTHGVPRSTWSTAPSWTFERLPMRMGATSPRITALNQTLDSDPISTSPITTAPGAR
jgi:hypothetical protein